MTIVIIDNEDNSDDRNDNFENSATEPWAGRGGAASWRWRWIAAEQLYPTTPLPPSSSVSLPSLSFQNMKI